MKLIPIANIFLALAAIALGLIYSSLHWVVPKLYTMHNIDNELKSTIVEIRHRIGAIAGNLAMLTIMIAIISVIIGYVSLKEKRFESVFLSIVFGISCLALILSLFLTTM